MKNKKTKLVIEWPENTHFSIEDVQAKYEKSPNITIRFRINQALEAKTIVRLGKTQGGVGRPILMFAKNPASNEVLTKAKAAGVILNSEHVVVSEVATFDSSKVEEKSTEKVKKSDVVHTNS